MTFIIDPYKFGAGGGGGDGSLSDVVSSACIDLDARVSDSYGGSGQTWSNLVTSPNDGSSQTDGDFHLGTDGSAGGDDPSFDTDRFDLDGGDTWRCKTNNSSIDDIHKTNNSGWWIGLDFSTGSTVANKALCGSGGWAGSNKGLYIWRGSTLQYWRNSSESANATPGLSASTAYQLVISMDMTSSTNNVRTWLNTTTKDVKSKSWGADTNNIGSQFVISGTTGGTPVDTVQSPLPNTTVIRAFAYGNAFIDDSDVSAIFTEWDSR